MVVEDPNGKKDAFITGLVNDYQAALLKTCFLYLKDEELARDAVQETFLKAYRACDAFRGECSVKSWLIRIAVNTCRDMRRGAWFRHVDRRVTPDTLPEPAAPIAERDEALTLAVMRLPDKLREAVLRYYYQRLSSAEAAMALGISQPSLSGRLRRARERLKTELGEGRI